MPAKSRCAANFLLCSHLPHFVTDTGYVVALASAGYS
jgi:hypothetical protein